MNIRKRLSPALLLFLLSPIIGELLSGSSPPAEFFNPAIFLLLAVLYGGGAILARELMHRWDKGWPTLLTLGAAYGIAEEGLMVKSFFDPNWEDLGLLGSYGRWAGVNWVWSLHLTIYHAVFSIAIPILLVNLMFPEHRSETWISRRTFKWLAGLWVAEIAFGFFFLTPYRPPMIPYLLALLSTIGLIRLARRLPGPASVPQTARIARPLRYGLAGFLATSGMFLLAWAMPTTGIPSIVTILLMAGLAVLTGCVLLKRLGNGVIWSERHQLALVSGALGFFILLAPLQELDQTRPDNTTGMTLVGLATLVFLVWMARRMRHTEQIATGAA